MFCLGAGETLKPVTPADRFRGSLLGLAVGDALGVALETKPPGSFQPVTDMVGGGWLGLKPGEWTDDTSLALCLAESLIERRRFDPADQLERYLQWYKEGHLSSTGQCFDIGGTTRRALLVFEETRAKYCGAAAPSSTSNGSVMRLAPVPLFYHRSKRRAVHLSGCSSKTTHANVACIDACRYLGALIVGVVNGESKRALLSDRYAPIAGYWNASPLASEIDEVASGSFKKREPPDIRATGHVARTLEAALWAFDRSDSFQEGALMAVNLGEDSDTVGAVYGQLAGAFYGVDSIPSGWLGKIVQRPMIESYANRLWSSSV